MLLHNEGECKLGLLYLDESDFNPVTFAQKTIIYRNVSFLFENRRFPNVKSCLRKEKENKNDNNLVIFCSLMCCQQTIS